VVVKTRHVPFYVVRKKNFHCPTINVIGKLRQRHGSG